MMVSQIHDLELVVFEVDTGWLELCLREQACVSQEYLAEWFRMIRRTNQPRRFLGYYSQSKVVENLFLCEDEGFVCVYSPKMLYNTYSLHKTYWTSNPSLVWPRSWTRPRPRGPVFIIWENIWTLVSSGQNQFEADKGSPLAISAWSMVASAFAFRIKARISVSSARSRSSTVSPFLSLILWVIRLCQ